MLLRKNNKTAMPQGSFAFLKKGATPIKRFNYFEIPNKKTVSTGLYPVRPYGLQSQIPEEA